MSPAEFHRFVAFEVKGRVYWTYVVLAAPPPCHGVQTTAFLRYPNRADEHKWNYSISAVVSTPVVRGTVSYGECLVPRKHKLLSACVLLFLHYGVVKPWPWSPGKLTNRKVYQNEYN